MFKCNILFTHTLIMIFLCNYQIYNAGASDVKVISLENGNWVQITAEAVCIHFILILLGQAMHPSIPLPLSAIDKIVGQTQLFSLGEKTV